MGIRHVYVFYSLFYYRNSQDFVIYLLINSNYSYGMIFF